MTMNVVESFALLDHYLGLYCSAQEEVRVSLTKLNRESEGQLRACGGQACVRWGTAASEKVHGHQRTGGASVIQRGRTSLRWAAATGKEADWHRWREGDEFLARRCGVLKVEFVAGEFPFSVGGGYGWGFVIADEVVHCRLLICHRLEWRPSKTSSAILKPDLHNENRKSKVIIDCFHWKVELIITLVIYKC